jgi:hypothetical protein
VAARLRLAVIAIAVVLSGAPAWADTAILIDHSGSLVKHYSLGSNGTFARLVRHIVDAAKSVEPPDVAVFNTEVTSLPNPEAFASVRSTGNTNLTKALQSRVGDYDTIWLLTDNVQDETGTKAGDMNTFYSALKAPAVRTVYVFPVLQDKGSSGLLVYALSTTDVTEGLVKQVARFQELAGFPPRSELLMKPLGDNTIDVVIEKPEEVLSFKEGDALTFEHDINIGAKYEHLLFRSSPARTTNVVSPFRDNSCLVAEKTESELSPNQVQTERRDTYTIKVNFGRVRLRKSPECLIKAAFGAASEPAEIQTPLVIDVRKDSLQLAPAFFDKYAAKDPETAKDLGKIYGIEQVPRFIAEDITPVPILVPRSVRIEYPKWPAVALILAGLMAVGLVALGGKVAVAALTPKLTLVAEDEHGTVLKSSFENGEVKVRDDVVGHVEGKTFTPVPGVRLAPDADGSIATPVLCTLPFGEVVRLRFGRGERASSRPPQAGAVDETPQPGVPLTRR